MTMGYLSGKKALAKFIYVNASQSVSKSVYRYCSWGIQYEQHQPKIRCMYNHISDLDCPFSFERLYSHPGSLIPYDQGGTRKQVAIIGGGIAGLVSAYELSQLNESHIPQVYSKLFPYLPDDPKCLGVKNLLHSNQTMNQVHQQFLL